MWSIYSWIIFRLPISMFGFLIFYLLSVFLAFYCYFPSIEHMSNKSIQYSKYGSNFSINKLFHSSQFSATTVFAFAWSLWAWSHIREMRTTKNEIKWNLLMSHLLFDEIKKKRKLHEWTNLSWIDTFTVWNKSKFIVITIMKWVWVRDLIQL